MYNLMCLLNFIDMFEPLSQLHPLILGDSGLEFVSIGTVAVLNSLAVILAVKDLFAAFSAWTCR